MKSTREISKLLSSATPDVLGLLEQLVNINSYTTNVDGVNAAQSVVADSLVELGLVVERHPLQNCGDVLIAKTGRANGANILLVGHIDTVHPPESVFREFHIDGNIATGPGVLDMKGGVVVILWALKILHQIGVLHQLPIVTFINSDEEIGSNYSHMLVDREARRANAALIFEWGRANDGVILRRKGVALWELLVAGVAAHSGNAHQEGSNAIGQIAHTILKLHTLTDYSRGITLSVGLIKGGTAVNTVPDLAEARLDVRVESMKVYEEVKEQIQAIERDIIVPGTTVQLKETLMLPCMEETSQSRALFESYQRWASMAGLAYGVFPGVIGGGSDANWSAFAGTPSIDGLGPFGEFPHSNREYISLDSLTKKTLNLVLWLAGQVIDLK